MIKSALLVGNPTAQSGKNATRIEEARGLLTEFGVPHRFVPTEPGGRTVGVVAAALADRTIDCAIYMGGDGTFAEVAKAILASGRAEDVRLGMLPTGTANDQGKSFGLSAEAAALFDNVAVIAAGREARLDVGRIVAKNGAVVVREDLFFDSAGWGISPRVLQLRNEDRKTIEGVPVLRELWRDQAVYLGAMLRTFAESYLEDDKFDVRCLADGVEHTWRGVSDLVVKGTRIYGGLWVFAPEARPDDGKFEVEPFVGKRDWLSKAIVALDQTGLTERALGQLGVQHSEGLSASRIELELTTADGALPLCAQIDGEEFPATTHVLIEVQPRRLRLLVPEAYATPAPGAG